MTLTLLSRRRRCLDVNVVVTRLGRRGRHNDDDVLNNAVVDVVVALSLSRRCRRDVDVVTT